MNRTTRREDLHHRSEVDAGIEYYKEGLAWGVRKLAAGTGITITDGGVNGSLTLATSGLVVIGYGAYADADQEVTTTTLATSTELTISSVAVGNYAFRAMLFTLNDGAAEGAKFAVTGTATLTALKAQISVYDDTLNSLAAFGRVTAIDTAVGAGLSTGDNFNVIEGNVRVSAAGSWAVSFAQNATGANAGVHLQVDSSLVMWKV